MRLRNRFSPFKADNETLAGFSQAKLNKGLGGDLGLKGGQGVVRCRRLDSRLPQVIASPRRR